MFEMFPTDNTIKSHVRLTHLCIKYKLLNVTNCHEVSFGEKRNFIKKKLRIEQK